MNNGAERGTATFQDYVERFPEIISFLEAKYGSPLPEDHQRYLLDTATSMVMKGEQIEVWMNRTVMYVDRIVKREASHGDFAMFWICVHGIISEYYIDLVKGVDFPEYRILCAPIFDSIEKVKQCLSEDDVSIIGFMRHSYCHIKLDYVWHKARKSKSGLVTIKSPVDPNVRDLVFEKNKEFGDDQQAMTRSYALLLEKELVALRGAVIAVMKVK